jgi:hypothetical protein
LIPAVALIFRACLAIASAGGPYWIDERGGNLTVVGTGRPPAATEHPAQARLLAERAAVVDAYGTAARMLLGAIPQAAVGREGYSAFFRGGRIVQSEIMPDGSVNVRLEIPLGPELAARIKGAGAVPGEPRIPKSEKPGVSHQEFVARHRVRGPRAITAREWVDRYRAGTWPPYPR